jgi:hypothetical protein
MDGISRIRKRRELAAIEAHDVIFHREKGKGLITRHEDADGHAGVFYNLLEHINFRNVRTPELSLERRNADLRHIRPRQQDSARTANGDGVHVCMFMTISFPIRHLPLHSGMRATIVYLLNLSITDTRLMEFYSTIFNLQISRGIWFQSRPLI